MGRGHPTSGLRDQRPSVQRRVAVLLVSNERLEHVFHPHWWRLIDASGGGLVGLIVAVLLAGVGLGPSSLVAAVVAVGSIAWIGIGIVRWRSELLLLTDRRVVFTRGVFTLRTSEKPLKHVNDVSTEQGLLGRLLDFGKVRIVSGSANGQEVVTYLHGPARLRQEISRLTQAGESASAATPQLPPASIVERIQALALLHRIGEISDEEFQRAKEQVLWGEDVKESEGDAGVGGP